MLVATAMNPSRLSQCLCWVFGQVSKLLLHYLAGCFSFYCFTGSVSHEKSSPSVRYGCGCAFLFRAVKRRRAKNCSGAIAFFLMILPMVTAGVLAWGWGLSMSLPMKARTSFRPAGGVRRGSIFFFFSGEAIGSFEDWCRQPLKKAEEGVRRWPAGWSGGIQFRWRVFAAGSSRAG